MVDLAPLERSTVTFVVLLEQQSGLASGSHHEGASVGSLIITNEKADGATQTPLKIAAIAIVYTKMEAGLRHAGAFLQCLRPPSNGTFFFFFTICKP